MAVDKAQQVYIGDAKKSLIDAFVVEAGKALELLPKTAGRTSVKWLETIPAEVEQLAWDGKETFYAVSKDKKSLSVIRKGAVAGEIKPDDMQHRRRDGGQGRRDLGAGQEEIPCREAGRERQGAPEFRQRRQRSRTVQQSHGDRCIGMQVWYSWPTARTTMCRYSVQTACS